MLNMPAATGNVNFYADLIIDIDINQTGYSGKERLDKPKVNSLR